MLKACLLIGPYVNKSNYVCDFYCLIFLKGKAMAGETAKQYEKVLLRFLSLASPHKIPKTKTLRGK